MVFIIYRDIFQYFTNFYSTRIKRGKDYYDDTEHILIDLSYNIKNEYPYKSVYYVQNENREHYVENFKIIEFNMDKITKECYDKLVEGVEEQYKYLCMLNLDLERLKELSETDDIVREYMDKLVDLNNNDEFRYVVSAEEDARLTQKLLQDYARDEGHAHGFIEGEKSTKMVVAKNMLINAESQEKIIKYTGLSIEEIEELKNNM